MKSSTSTSTALARVLALPLMAGLLAGCDYASKLPDAPTTLGYELQGPKPPSITAPVEIASAPPPGTLGNGLNTKALQVAPEGISVPRTALALPPASGELPAPELAPVGPPPPPPSGESDFALLDAGGYVSPSTAYQTISAPPSPPAPQFGISAAPGSSAPVFETVPMAEPSRSIQPVAVASLPADQAYAQDVFSDQGAPLYDVSTGLQPLEYGASVGQGGGFVTTAPIATTPVETVPMMTQSMPAPTVQASPITVLHARLDNGAVLNVHPVVGAPGSVSMALARTIAAEIGAPVDASALGRAPAVLDLRASASSASGRAEAEWKLFSNNGALVGIFPESHSGGGWTSMGDGAVQAMGRRVADRLRRNANLRRATLTSLASAPPITSIDYSAVLPGGAPSLAPMPRQRPARATMVQPVQMAAAPPPPPAPRFVVNTQAIQPTDPMAGAVPRRRPEGVRMAALSPVAPLQPLQPIATQPIAPLPPLEPVSAPQPIAPLATTLPTAPIAAPAPSFDTLRASADGPRALVFRGVRGAPGNGDQALGREVSRLLGQSGAQLAPDGTPNALYLTADVSRTRNGGSDSIKILWHVEEADGTRVGQVVQENDVPAGSLDASWGEDAFYAAQGARDGIMELLRGAGAIDA